MKKLPSADRVYKLVKDAAPLSYTLPIRNTRRYPLLWFDEDNNVTRALRYAVNQKSPFEDEQDGNAIIEPVVFENGFLSVAKSNPVLQEFLFYHPLNGKVFVEVNKEKDAATHVDNLNIEVDALIQARELTTDQLETVYRVLFGKDPQRVTTAELKRDILVFAKRYPKELLNTLNDPMLRHNSTIHRFFNAKLLTLRNNGKEVWFNTSSNKKKMLSVPYGHDPYEVVGQYLQSDEGIDYLKMLESNLEQ